MRTSVFFATLASYTLFTIAAAAQDAKTLFEDALRATQAGDLKLACELFERSYALEAAGGTLMNIAGCRESRKDYVGAYNAFSEALGRAEREGKTERASAARLRLAELESKVARIRLRSPDAPSPARVIYLDARPAPSLTERPMAVEPGPHSVEVRSGNTILHSLREEVKVGELVDRSLPSLEAPGSTPATPEKEPQQPAEDPSRGSSQRALGIVIGLAGIASIGVGTATGIVALNEGPKGRDLKDGSDERQTARSKYATAADLSTITFIAGGVAVAGGLYLYLAAPSPKRKITVGVAPTIGGASVVGKF